MGQLNSTEAKNAIYTYSGKFLEEHGPFLLCCLISDMC